MGTTNCLVRAGMRIVNTGQRVYSPHGQVRVNDDRRADTVHTNGIGYRQVSCKIGDQEVEVS